MRVVAHLDPVVLEGELLRRIGEVQDRNGKTAAVLVVVPTSRLVDHLQRRLAKRFDAVLGVEIVHFHGLARKILEGNENGFQSASGRVLTELLRRCIGELPDGNLLKRYVAERPGAASSLMSSIRDLREAGVDPDDFKRLARSAPDLALLYKIYCDRLAKLGEHKITDEAGFINAAHKAMDTDPAFRNRFQAVFLYGAYELLGVHLDLLRKLEPATALMPFDPAGNAPAGAYAERFARKFLMETGEEAEVVDPQDDRSIMENRLHALYLEDSDIAPLQADDIELSDFQGLAHEAVWAVRQALASGTDPKEICILARDLNRYGPYLESELGQIARASGNTSAWTGSLAEPLRRNPAVHDALVLLEVLNKDFPRAPTVELLSSPRVRWHLLHEEQEDASERPDGPSADTWSRSAGILGSLDSWRRNLPAEAGRFTSWNLETEEEQAEEELKRKERVHIAERVTGCLQALKTKFGAGTPGTWTGQAERLGRMLRLLPEHTTLENLLQEMALLDAVTPQGGVTGSQAVAWLEAAVDGAESSISHTENGGIRVLDFMQARNLTFRHVFLLGFHAGSFPRIPREDPFLDESLRRKIDDELRLPISHRAEGSDEEHLLLALMLGAGRNKISISWQRADDTGRSVSPSPALREIARTVLGRPDTKTLLRDAVAHRVVHPEGRLEEIGNATGMLTKPEACIFTGFSVPEDLPDDPILREALGLGNESMNLLRAIELFRFGDSAWDGRIGPGFTNPERAWSATALEMLGRCPLQFLFRKVLGVEELENEQSPLELDPREMGTAVHAVLEKLYRDLANEGRFQKGTAAELGARGLELLIQHWEPAFANILAKVEPRMEALYRIRESLWHSAVESFIRKDLQSLTPLPDREVELEVPATRTVKLDNESEIRIAGRFDRVIREPEPGGDTPQRAIIADYKTGGNLKERMNATYMLKGKRLQVPVYHLLQEPFPTVQLLGVGPNFDPDDKESCPDPFEGFEDEQLRGMIESLSILARLIRDGVFPLVDDERQCKYCGFRPACRVKHPPTLEREANAADSASFRLLQLKTAKNPLVSDSI